MGEEELHCTWLQADSHEQRLDFSTCRQGPAESQHMGIWGAGRLHARTMPWVTVVLVFLK